MKQYVYVMEAKSGLIKVGKASNPEKRRSMLQKTSGLGITIKGVYGPFNAAGKVENAVHRLFSDCRHDGEWFACNAVEVMDAIKALVDRFEDIKDETEEENSSRERLFNAMMMGDFKLQAELTARVERLQKERETACRFKPSQSARKGAI